MKNLIITFLLLYSGNVLSEYGFYTDVAIGYHKESYDCPEACFEQDLLAKFETGYEFENGFYINYTHISAPERKDKGLNTAFIGYRKYWNF